MAIYPFLAWSPPKWRCSFLACHGSCIFVVINRLSIYNRSRWCFQILKVFKTHLSSKNWRSNHQVVTLLFKLTVETLSWYCLQGVRSGIYKQLPNRIYTSYGLLSLDCCLSNKYSFAFSLLNSSIERMITLLSFGRWMKRDSLLMATVSSRSCKLLARSEILVIFMIFIINPLRLIALLMCFQPIISPTTVGDEWYFQFIGILHFL